MTRRKQTILITGAAKRIGAVIARRLAQEGYDLVLHYHRSARDAETLARKLRRAGVKVTLVKADLTNPALLKRFWKKLPACTGLVHNASSFSRDTLDSFTPGQLRTQLAIHLEAPLILAQGFMKQLPEKTTGSIVLIGDGADGWSVGPSFFSYAVGKRAMASAVDLLAAACAPRARVNLLAPGPTLRGPGETGTLFAKLAASAPLKRNGTAEEVAGAVAYLLAAPGVTGQALSLSGGYGLTTLRRGFPAA